MLWQLIKKEVRLQTFSLMFALGIVLLWGLMMASTPRASIELLPRQLTLGQLLLILEGFVLGPAMVALVPLFIGAGMVSEERSLGMWDWQLSLPVSRRAQWGCKLAVGAVLAGILTFAIEWPMELALVRALGETRDAVTPFFMRLREQGGITALPFFCLGIGALASTHCNDGYKALFVSFAMSAAIYAAAHLADPVDMLVRHPITENRGWVFGAMILLAGCAALLGLANFRFTPPTGRKAALQAALLAIGAVLISSTTVNLMMSPRDLFTQDRARLHALLHRSESLFFPGPEFNLGEKSITPLLMRRDEPFRLATGNPGSDRRFAAAMDRNFLDAWSVQRIPHSSLLFVEAGPWRQAVEINVNTSGLRCRSEFFPSSVEFDTGSNRYRPNNDLVVGSGLWPWPVKNNGVVEKLLRWTGWFDVRPDLESNSYRGLENVLKIDDGRSIQPQENPKTFYSSLTHHAELVQVWTENGATYTNELLKRKPDLRWTSLAKIAGDHIAFFYSRDLKWVGYDSFNPHQKLPLIDPTLVAADGSTSVTLKSDGMLTRFHPSFRDAKVANAWEAAVNADDHQFIQSPDGRFVAIFREGEGAGTANEASSSQNDIKPSSVGVVDLQTKLVHWLVTLPMPDARRRMKTQLALGSMPGREDWVFEPQLPVYYNWASQRDIPTGAGWAPEGLRLAVLKYHQLLILEYDPARAQEMANLKIEGDMQGVRDLTPIGPGYDDGNEFFKAGFILEQWFDLQNLDIKRFMWWDADRIVAWGTTGVYRIDVNVTPDSGMVRLSNSRP